MNELLSLVINLDGSDQRWADASSQLDAAGLNFERLAAVDARGQSPESFAQYDEKRAFDFYGRAMTGGEIGCYLSHLKCAKRLLDSDCDYALVLEDDVALAENFTQILQTLIQNLDAGVAPDWELINLGRHGHKLKTPVSDICGHSLEHAFYFPVTTTALLWSRKGAKAFYDSRDTIYAPVDHYFRKMFSQRGTGFALNPPCAIPSGAESDIDTAVLARNRIPRTPAYFWSEFKRQSKNYVNAWKHKTQTERLSSGKFQ